MKPPSVFPAIYNDCKNEYGIRSKNFYPPFQLRQKKLPLKVEKRLQAMRTAYQTGRIVAVFSVAMGILEAVVVVYLRQIYYPHGFSFPLTLLNTKTYFVELLRELTTLVMLVSVSLLAGKSRNQKFAWFLFAFALWDLTYYAALKLFLDWPVSWLTWDVLFLIPVTWVGPVLAPVICSLTMLLLAFMILRKPHFRFTKASLWLMLSGAALIFFSFVQDYGTLLLHQNLLLHKGMTTRQSVISVLRSFVPSGFNWPVFISGELFITVSLVLLQLKNRKNKTHASPRNAPQESLA